MVLNLVLQLCSKISTWWKMKWNNLFSSYNVFNHTLQCHAALTLVYQVPSLCTSSSNDYQKDTNICLNLYARESFKIESLHPKGDFRGDGRELGGLIQSNIRSVRIHVGLYVVCLAWTWNFNQHLMLVMKGIEKGTKQPWTTCRTCVYVCVMFIVHAGLYHFLGILEDHLKA